MIVKRPPLRLVALAEVWPLKQGLSYCTMSAGQWDTILHGAYDAGFVLLELDDDEVPVAAYWNPKP